MENGLWRTNVNILQTTLAYMNITINVKPEMWNLRLERTGPAKPAEIRGLTGQGPGSACEESADWVVGRVWNRTDLFCASDPDRRQVNRSHC